MLWINYELQISTSNKFNYQLKFVLNLNCVGHHQHYHLALRVSKTIKYEMDFNLVEVFVLVNKHKKIEI